MQNNALCGVHIRPSLPSVT